MLAWIPMCSPLRWALRSFVAEAGTRWIYGGVVAAAASVCGHRGTAMAAMAMLTQQDDTNFCTLDGRRDRQSRQSCPVSKYSDTLLHFRAWAQVALVNVVLMAFVVWCFAEGFPDADGPSLTAPNVHHENFRNAKPKAPPPAANPSKHEPRRFLNPRHKP